MSNVEAAINWMLAKRGKITYSMAYRNGPASYDCSSSVYFALNASGWNFPHIGNTESMFNDLVAQGWYELPRRADGGYDAQRGDIFIWGRRGYSSGAFGHTGIFLDADNIVHCNFGYNGMSVNNHDVIWAANRRPYCTIFRYKGHAPAAAPSVPVNTFKNPDANAPRWHVEAGDTLAKISNYYFGNTKHVAAIAKYNAIPNENAINVGQTIYIPGPLKWIVDPGDTWEKIDNYYGYGHGWTKSRNPGKSLTPGTVLSIWG